MLVKVYERKLDTDGEIKFTKRPDKFGDKHNIAEATIYYIDLDENQEKKLLDQGKKYSIERVFKPEDISPQDIDKGLAKKNELFPA